jgi:nicotinate-nucleotide adenylyltransferase
MKEARRIGVLGGTLDPIHLGHLDAALAAKEALRLDRVLVIPSHIPPHRARPVSSAFHRFAMAAIAINGVDGVAVSDIELASATPSYTADTLLQLRHTMSLAPSQIFFITGTDAFAEIETWRQYPNVLDLANFVVISRPGTALASLRTQLPQLRDRMRLPIGDAILPKKGVRHLKGPDPFPHATAIFLVDAPTTDVSSTEVRRRMASGLPVDGLVPPGVEHHIKQHGLYTERSILSSTADHLHGQN